MVNGDLPRVPRSLRDVGGFVDDRFGGAGLVCVLLKKIFPDHCTLPRGPQGRGTLNGRPQCSTVRPACRPSGCQSSGWLIGVSVIEMSSLVPPRASRGLAATRRTCHAPGGELPGCVPRNYRMTLWVVNPIRYWYCLGVLAMGERALSLPAAPGRGAAHGGASARVSRVGSFVGLYPHEPGTVRLELFRVSGVRCGAT